MSQICAPLTEQLIQLVQAAPETIDRLPRQHRTSSASRIVTPRLTVDPADLIADRPAEKPLKLAAKRPDASPRKSDTMLRVAVHALLLACIIVFVVYYCVYTPLYGQFAGAKERAHVESVAPSLNEIRAPEVSGVFHAIKPLANGTPVAKGEILGRIESPALIAQIDQKALELRMLQWRRLQLEQQAGERGPGYQQEARDLALREAGARQALNQLEGVRRQLVVRAPADGLVHMGLAATMSVNPHDTIVSLYPQGSDLVIEVTAPLEVINALEGQERVVADFSTPAGKVQVTATPVHGSTRSIVKATSEKRTEIWGVLVCRPTSMPDSVSLPGLVGKLH